MIAVVWVLFEERKMPISSEISGVPRSCVSCRRATHHSRKTGSDCADTSSTKCEAAKVISWPANYYAKFIPNLATVLNPLNVLLKKDSTWNWSSDCTKAFQLAKDTLTSSKVLVHFDPAMLIKLAADASVYRVGGVIAHVLPDGSERTIAFAS